MESRSLSTIFRTCSTRSPGSGKNIPCVFNNLTCSEIDARNSSAMLIAVNQSNHKRSYTQRKRELGFERTQKSQNLKFPARYCNRRLRTLKQNDLSAPHVRATPPRVELSGAGSSKNHGSRREQATFAAISENPARQLPNKSRPMASGRLWRLWLRLLCWRRSKPPARQRTGRAPCLR